MTLNTQQFEFEFDYKKYVFTLYVDEHISNQIINRGVFYEDDLLFDIAKCSLEEGAIIDIGANLGNHTVYFASVLSRKVYAFEPNAQNYSLLKKNISANGLAEVVDSFCCALGAEKGNGIMSSNPLNMGMSKFETSNEGAVEKTTLDSILDLNEKVACIKIDVEGMELDVLHGAFQIIERSKPLLIIEAHTAQRFIEIQTFLNQFGYRAFGVKGRTRTYFFDVKNNEHSFIDQNLFLTRLDLDQLDRSLRFFIDKISRQIDSIAIPGHQEANLSLNSSVERVISEKTDKIQMSQQSLTLEIDGMARRFHSFLARDTKTISELVEHGNFEQLEKIARLIESFETSRDEHKKLNGWLDERESLRISAITGIGERLSEIKLTLAQHRSKGDAALEGIQEQGEVIESEIGTVINTLAKNTISDKSESQRQGVALEKGINTVVEELAKSNISERKEIQEQGIAIGKAINTVIKELAKNKTSEKKEIQQLEKKISELGFILTEVFQKFSCLDDEIVKLRTDLYTERSRKRHLSRRLKHLYSSGSRNVVGNIRRLLSKVTFGKVSKFENWDQYQVRLESRVRKEVTEFKQLNKAIKIPSLGSLPEIAVRAEEAGFLNSLEEKVTLNTSFRVIKPEVRIGIASIFKRSSALRLVIDSLYDQADKIVVYLNDYPTIPDYLKRTKIDVIHGEGDLGDRGKFYGVDDFEGYIFACDDDIRYPSYYVEHCIDAIERYGRAAVVGWHGSLLKDEFTDYYSPESRRVFSFRAGRPEDMRVHVLGTGCVAYHSSTIQIQLKDFETPNMADVYFAILGQKQSIPFVVIKHDPAEALPIDVPDDTPINLESKNSTGSVADTKAFQNKMVLNWDDWVLPEVKLAYERNVKTIAYVGRLDRERWKKGGILRSGHLILQALRSLGYRVLPIEIEQPLEKIKEQSKLAQIIWVYPGDPERPDFQNVVELLEHSASQKKRCYVNLSFNLVDARTEWLVDRLSKWRKQFGGLIKACVFTSTARDYPKLFDVQSNIICLPKTIDFKSGVLPKFDEVEGVFLGDLQKLLNKKLVAGSIEDWIAELKKELPDATLYVVRQYGGKIDRNLGVEIAPYAESNDWHHWLSHRKIVCSLTPHATFEMIPIEAAGIGIPVVYRPMLHAHDEALSYAGVRVENPRQFAKACGVLYKDRGVWLKYQQMGADRARSLHVDSVKAVIHMQFQLDDI